MARGGLVWPVDVVGERGPFVVAQEGVAPQIPAHLMPGDVDRDPEQPGPYARAAAVRARRSAGLEERRADDVLDVDDVRRSKESRCEPVQCSIVAIEQRAQRGAVVDGAGGDQRLVAQLAGRSGELPQQKQ